jgi:hypothetical protein
MSRAWNAEHPCCRQNRATCIRQFRDEEQHLYGNGELADRDQVPLEGIKIDQC